MRQEFSRISKINGELNLPGDKSVSHRSVMFSALAKGKSTVYNCLQSEDLHATINAFRLMGCNIKEEGSTIFIEGRGFKGLQKPEKELDFMNSGTTTRLMSGILSAQDFESTIIGDASLSKRPMKRVIDPLTQMGAIIKSTGEGFLPMTIYPSANLHPVEYRLPVASAQVKSAVLLAGIHLDEKTTIIEDIPTRNHTENLLGLDVKVEGTSRIITSLKANYPQAGIYNVPSDISSAAFFIILALLTPNSELKLNSILLNETRTGILQVLRMMGAEIIEENVQIRSGEKTGDLIIKSSKLKNVEIPAELIPNIIDEIPILSVAGIFAEGDFEVRGAEELRHKESDRIKTVCDNFNKVGIAVDEYSDGFKLSGNAKGKSALFESFTDHRIAMAFSVFSLLNKDGGIVEGFEACAVSNPDFLEQVKQIVI
ncbi:MAG: 3-phosphoshikimate 1-carboxyvinyltransferase [Ignavibacteria bacterium]|nr:3-phosphoshikimate 1-carboxyvinyltransferase [Ignavibacteria bacterium]